MSCPIHSFDVSFKEAKQIQSELCALVKLTDTVSLRDDVDLVGGADVAFITQVPGTSRKYTDGIKGSSESHTPEHIGKTSDITALAVVVTYDIKRCCVEETAYAAAPVVFPYVPGYLSFREGPAILAALGKLNMLPGVMLYDGCGIAHPRGFGLASHMAALSGIPSVGCAKSRLCGICSMPGSEKGSWTYIICHDRPVGTCLRTRDNVKPVYVSPGSGFSIDSARELVLSLAGKYRLPEPTRLAHNLVTEKKKLYKKSELRSQNN
ncbi:endonuclease V [Candidatus Latescibacterota bacterium]